MTSPDLSHTARTDPDAAGIDPASLARLGGALQGFIDAGRLPGAVALVVRRGVLAWFESFGRQSPLRSAPMRRDAIFRLYSMTKPVTSLAALMLLERGRLLLTDPVARYLPAFGDVRLGVERGGRLELVAPARPITLHDLLRHTSGLTYEFLAPSAVRARYAQARVASRKLNGAEFCATLAGLPLMREPGSAFGYGRSTDVLGHVIEQITGRRLGEHLRETIFEPLGMRDTAFHAEPAQHARLAEAFASDPDSGAPVRLNDVLAPSGRDSGGGGLVGTAADYARFLALLLGGGSVDGARLVGRKTVEWMTADHLGVLPNACELLPPGHGFGLGVAVRLQPGVGAMPGSAGTYGWGGLAGTVFFVDPREDMFAVLMIQAPGQASEVQAVFRNLVYAALR